MVKVSLQKSVDVSLAGSWDAFEIRFSNDQAACMKNLLAILIPSPVRSLKQACLMRQTAWSNWDES